MQSRQPDPSSTTAFPPFSVTAFFRRLSDLSNLAASQELTLPPKTAPRSVQTSGGGVYESNTLTCAGSIRGSRWVAQLQPTAARKATTIMRTTIFDGSLQHTLPDLPVTCPPNPLHG